jgi:hypothetical protein
VRARLGAVRRCECVHDVDVAERRHLLRKLVLVLLLAVVEPHVLEQHDLARLARDAAEPFALEAHLLPEQLGEPDRHRSERELRVVDALLRTPEMRHQHHARARGERCLDSRQRRADPRIARDDAVLHRHVEILADQHSLAAQIHVGHALDGDH